MKFKVKKYESYVDYYPGTTTVKQAFSEGAVFEMDEESIDPLQKDRIEPYDDFFEDLPIVSSGNGEFKESKPVEQKPTTPDELRESVRKKLEGK